MLSDYFNHDTHVARINEEDACNESTSHHDTILSHAELKDAIRENAIGPKRVQSDAGSVEQHSLKDQIDVERFLQSQKATRKPGLGIKLVKLSPDGTV